jgi:hypothetical protein
VLQPLLLCVGLQRLGGQWAAGGTQLCERVGGSGLGWVGWGSWGGNRQGNGCPSP